ncbi:5-(carboxyamino)imidazole ribonucleotide mutase [Prochlorococcus marinus]|uniref:5-(carboxyamino)imidazole ribonucleotide mutase n=1 Tax=Prochlorococcus marinus TaxID=1219 RepID=UPI0022B413DE|nr:5-(carboxyamino)imidazole ribonucleotide mutase [Prochlorococcus marinus]
MKHALKTVPSANAEQKVLVAVVMGSDSDLPVLEAAIKVLEEFNQKVEVRVLSAHRTPHRMFDYAKEAENKGIKIIIAGAGGAAHLPGMIASLTNLPVIGVPIKSKSLQGIDSLYSIVQMPSGVPVATVAINGGHNAGLLAIQILAISDSRLKLQLSQYKKRLYSQVLEKDEKLRTIGTKSYLEQMEL